MFWPLGETGVGKMGEIPPGACTSQDERPRRNGQSTAAGLRPSRAKYIGAGKAIPGTTTVADRIQTDVAASKQPRMWTSPNHPFAVECPRCGC